MNGIDSTRHGLLSEWQGFNTTIDQLDRIKTFDHLILSYFWERREPNDNLEFDGVDKLVFLHKIRLSCYSQNKI